MQSYMAYITDIFFERINNYLNIKIPGFFFQYKTIYVTFRSEIEKKT